jgi:hypothetical protein
MRDWLLSPQRSWGLRSSGMLFGVGRHFNWLTVENGTYVFRNVDNQLPTTAVRHPRRSKISSWEVCASTYRGADKSLAWPRRKEARKHVRDARDFNNIETRAVSKFLFLQGKASKEIHAILTETLGCFLPGRAKNLSAPLYLFVHGRCRWGFGVLRLT